MLHLRRWNCQYCRGKYYIVVVLCVLTCFPGLFFFPEEHRLSFAHRPGKDKVIEGCSVALFPFQSHSVVLLHTLGHPLLSFLSPHMFAFPSMLAAFLGCPFLTGSSPACGHLAPIQNSTPSGCSSSALLQLLSSCSPLQFHMLLAWTSSIFQHSRHETGDSCFALWGTQDQSGELVLDQKEGRMEKIQLTNAPQNYRHGQLC